MTNPEREAMDERIRDMKRRGIPRHVRVEILKRELAAEAAARAEPEPPDPPVAEPRGAPVTEESAGCKRKRKAVRKTGQEAAASRNTEDKRAMNARTQAVPLKIADPGDSTTTAREPAGKSDREPADPPAKADGQATNDVRPRLIDAAAAARLCGVSKSGWWAFHAAGRCPLPVRLGRATRWRQDELSDWIDAGCPARSKWAWKPGRRR